MFCEVPDKTQGPKKVAGSKGPMFFLEFLGQITGIKLHALVRPAGLQRWVPLGRFTSHVTLGKDSLYHLGLSFLTCKMGELI